MRRMDGVSTPVETRHRALLDALPDLMLRLSRDGVYLEFAGDVTRLASPADELIGSRVYDLLPEHASTALMGAVHQALDSGELARAQYRLQTLLGEDREFEARVVPCGGDEAMAIIRDVTE